MSSSRPHRATFTPRSNQAFPVTALPRRYTTPSPYTLVEQPAVQLRIDPTMPVQDQVDDSSFFPFVPSDTMHQYNLKSRGRDYAFINVTSHALNAQDPPLLYFGEELTGFVELSLNDLSDMRSMDVVLQMFDYPDSITPSYEAKRILHPDQVQVDDSNVSGGQFCWPFALASPTPSALSSSGSSILPDPPNGRQSSRGHNVGNDPKYELSVTIYRRGRLNKNLGVSQTLSYVIPPDPSLRSSPRPISVDLPCDPPPNPSWRKQRLPLIRVKGFAFGRDYVEVECQLVIPKSYKTSDLIPLCLTLTCENQEAFNLVAVSHVIDVRLQKVMGFGKQAATIGPLSLMNRSSYHRTDLAARAHWEPDGHPTELPPDEEHPRSRWSIKLNGNLHRETKVELCPSFEGPGMAVMYLVGFYPFRSSEFRPSSDPKKPLLLGKIQLAGPNRSQR